MRFYRRCPWCGEKSFAPLSTAMISWSWRPHTRLFHGRPPRCNACGKYVNLVTALPPGVEVIIWVILGALCVVTTVFKDALTWWPSVAVLLLMMAFSIFSLCFAYLQRLECPDKGRNVNDAFYAVELPLPVVVETDAPLSCVFERVYMVRLPLPDRMLLAPDKRKKNIFMSFCKVDGVHLYKCGLLCSDEMLYAQLAPGMQFDIIRSEDTKITATIKKLP